MEKRKWCVCGYDEKKVENIVAQNGVAPYTALLLSARGITAPAEVRSFCFDEEGLCDPFLLPDMEKAVDCINEALDAGEKIAVYGDYDADGLTATVILYTYLLSQGADVIYYVPDRNTEGYGMNKAAVNKIYDEGVKLIVTVDNGISAFEEAELINRLGMKLVVTDHHTVSDRLPEAIAVVNPHRQDSRCAFRDWAGVGVAFKLICALEGEDGEYMLDEYAQLVSIGTIADVVPLVGENRYIVRRGIELMNSEPVACIEAMKEAADYSGKELNATSVAFTIVPRINAMGRISTVKPVLELLMENGNLPNYARMLHECNAERQRIEQEILCD
ncbi:MAG: DHH family phosphoesterase, partial [Clostridia bacterium]|nr:DHH family phosphoesterase [Clostridia bacterium]